MKKIFTLLFISGLLQSTTSNAQFALKEDFVYPAQSLTAGPISSIFWRSTSGTAGQMMVTTGGLTYAGYKVASALSNKVSLVKGNSEDATGFVDIDQNGVVDVNDTIATALIPNFYYSFLIKVADTVGLTANSGAGDYFQAILPNNNTTVFSARLFIRKGSTDGYQLGLRMNSNASVPTVWATGAGDNMVPGSTYLLAFHYSFNAVGTKDDMVEMWVNPPLDGSIPASLISSSNVDASTTLDLTKLGAILLRQGSNTPNADIDGIAAGISWADVVLPIGLQSFSASLQSSQGQLNWQLPTTVDARGFSVERSIDGRVFEAIGYVAANNSSAYSFADANIKNGVNYYRIKVINKDGSFTYSAVATIVNREFVVTTIFPNPAKRNITLTHDKAGNFATVTLLTIDGRSLQTTKVQNGATQTALILPELAAGQYMLMYENNGAKTLNKFVKE